ncbi:hypothetical protein, partial [Streptomyces noursei]
IYLAEKNAHLYGLYFIVFTVTCVVVEAQALAAAKKAAKKDAKPAQPQQQPEAAQEEGENDEGEPAEEPAREFTDDDLRLLVVETVAQVARGEVEGVRSRGASLDLLIEALQDQGDGLGDGWQRKDMKQELKRIHIKVRDQISITETHADGTEKKKRNDPGVHIDDLRKCVSPELRAKLGAAVEDRTINSNAA